MTKRVTLLDVANHAGVSRATASLVLRDAGNLTDETRERVRVSMRELGYVYHRGAASMRASRSRTVGLVVANLANTFTAEMAIGLESTLAEAGVVTLTASSFDDPERQDTLVTSLLELHVDGIIVVPANHSTASFVRRLTALNVPAMIASRQIGSGGITYVGIDDRHGGRLAGEHLVQIHGCRSLAYLGGFDLRLRRDRIRGLRRVIDSAPGTTLVADQSGGIDGRWGLSTIRTLLEGDGIPDGLVCHTDEVAFGVYRGLRDHAPELVSSVRVVSFDDVAEAALWEPPLTSIAAQGHEVGEQAAAALLRGITEPKSPTERIRVTPHLVRRKSCGCHNR